MDENRFICKEDYISSKLQGRKQNFESGFVLLLLIS